MPYAFNFVISFAWLNVSHAQLKSMKTAPTNFPFSISFLMSSRNSVAASSVNRRAQYPNCRSDNSLFCSRCSFSWLWIAFSSTFGQDWKNWYWSVVTLFGWAARFVNWGDSLCLPSCRYGSYRNERFIMWVNRWDISVAQSAMLQVPFVQIEREHTEIWRSHFCEKSRISELSTQDQRQVH